MNTKETLDTFYASYSVDVQRSHLKCWFWRVLIWVDQGANVLFSPLLNLFLPEDAVEVFGHEDRTLSHVFACNAPRVKWCYLMCRFLHWFDKDHCKKSIGS